MGILIPFKSVCALAAAFLAGIASAVPAKAQQFLATQDIPEANRLIDTNSKQANSLKCDILKWKPFVDFDFRYVSLFGISAPAAQFVPGQRLTMLLRITPAQGKPVLLAHNFQIQPIPPDMSSSFNPKTFRVDVSGGFATGEGRYVVELLLYDDRGRVRYKRWTVAAISDNKLMTPLLAPSTVAPLVANRWDGRLDPDGFRLTVLLDATAVRAMASDLREERFLLLQLLASLLRQVPCESVMVVAFNLDQQREIFREEHFDGPGFVRLSTVLQNLQLSIVPYKALQSGNAARFLADLAEEQNSAQQSPDAVIFIGSNTHVTEKRLETAQESPEVGTSHFYYFEYFGFRTPFPDTIDYLTRDLHGTVFRINSVRDFGTDVEKLRAQLAAARGTQNSPDP
jgi:hypothetical protein